MTARSATCATWQSLFQEADRPGRYCQKLFGCAATVARRPFRGSGSHARLLAGTQHRRRAAGVGVRRKITTFRKLAEEAMDLLLPTLGASASTRRHWTGTTALPGGDFNGLDFEGYVASFRSSRAWLPEALARRYVRAYGNGSCALQVTPRHWLILAWKLQRACIAPNLLTW